MLSVKGKPSQNYVQDANIKSIVEVNEVVSKDARDT